MISVKCEWIESYLLFCSFIYFCSEMNQLWVTQSEIIVPERGGWNVSKKGMYSICIHQQSLWKYWNFVWGIVIVNGSQSTISIWINDIYKQLQPHRQNSGKMKLTKEMSWGKQNYIKLHYKLCFGFKPIFRIKWNWK